MTATSISPITQWNGLYFNAKIYGISSTYHAHAMEQLPGVTANMYSIALLAPASGATRPTRHYFILTDDPFTKTNDWTDFQQASAKPDFDASQYYLTNLTEDKVKPLSIPKKKDYEDFIKIGIGFRQDEKAGVPKEEALAKAKETFEQRQDPLGKLREMLQDLKPSKETNKPEVRSRSRSKEREKSGKKDKRDSSPFKLPSRDNEATGA